MPYSAILRRHLIVPFLAIIFFGLFVVLLIFAWYVRFCVFTLDQLGTTADRTCLPVATGLLRSTRVTLTLIYPIPPLS